MLHLAFMESGRILCGILNEEKTHLDEAAQVVLRSVVPKKDKDQPDYGPEEKPKPIIEVGVVGITHSVFCFSGGVRIPHFISIKNALTVLPLSSFNPDVQKPVQFGYDSYINFQEKPAIEPDKAQGESKIVDMSKVRPVGSKA
jgi:hypothetical protein